MNVWYAGQKEIFIQPCIPDSNSNTVTNTRCPIGTVFSPDDGHIVARNTQRRAINILRKILHQFGSFYKIKQHILQAVICKW
jgi:hypothetical protein